MGLPTVNPYVSDPDFQLYVGDVRDVLAELPSESVHCVVTSPPYWGLRDYGTGEWEGGDEGCDHAPPPTRYSPTSTPKNDGRPNPGAKNYELQTPTPYRDTCGKCGAHRIDRQLGLEPTPDCGARGYYRLRADLTESQREFVVRRLAGVEIPDA